jgi:hypothetical protein
MARSRGENGADLRDVAPRELDRERLGAKSPPFARVARPPDDEPADLVVGDPPFVGVVVVVGLFGPRLGEARLEPRHQPLVLLRAAPLRLRRAEEDRVPLLFGELLPRDVRAHADGLDGA